MKRSMYFVLSVLVLASMLLASCGGGAKTGKGPGGSVPFPTGGKTITVAFSQEPDLVDSIFSSMSYAEWVAQGVLVGLGYQNINDVKPEHYGDLFNGIEALK